MNIKQERKYRRVDNMYLYLIIKGVLVILLTILLVIIVRRATSGAVGVMIWSWIAVDRLAHVYYWFNNEEEAGLLHKIVESIITNSVILETFRWIINSNKSQLRKLQLFNDSLKDVNHDLAFLISMTQQAAIRYMVLNLPLIQVIMAIFSELSLILNRMMIWETPFNIIYLDVERIEDAYQHQKKK